MRRTALVLAVVLAAPSAFADTQLDKKTCSESYEKAQVLQKDNKMTDARAQLLVCSQEACPGWIKTECVKWLADIDEHQPSIVIAARDAQGKDVLDASVEIDGSMISSKVDGTAVKVDPGPHTVKLVHDGQTTEQQIVARVGEKNRTVEIVLKGAPTTEPPPVDHAPKRGSPIPAIATGVLGLGAIGASIGLTFATKSDVDTMRMTCAPRCNPSDVDAANTKLIVANVLFGVGVAAVAAGVLLFIFRPTVKENTALVVRPGQFGLRF